MYACFSKYVSSSDDVVYMYSSVPGRISIGIPTLLLMFAVVVSL
jgi:hypothetical protein